MIQSVLVANRGEIARRVFRTCRDLGTRTVAVYSDADVDSPYVREADSAVHLPGAAASETYLRGDLIIDAAERSGADAVHPGYGFLSENAGFAKAVVDAGLTWIGPPPEAIDSMGSKVEAKALMDRAGVPVLGQIDPENATDADLPLIVKAAFGGGGRGMRVVTDLAELRSEVALASAEAASAFGDPTVFCEPYIASGYHVEVQVLADAHGNVWTVGERECSIQRRHQKVVEETPSPLFDRCSGVREKMFAAATAAASAIDYVGAGTVEFMADDSGRFFFLEMNTRLQVEHPVSECVSGLDLVAKQLEIADGAVLEGDSPRLIGHSIEVRLYAEDPSADYQPQSGILRRVEIPGVDACFDILTRPGVRLDSGVEDGSVIGTHYDAMLAKVISWAPSRKEATRRLRSALSRAKIHGLITNRDLLVEILGSAAFIKGETDTGFLENRACRPRPDAAVAFPPEASADPFGVVRLSAVAAALSASSTSRAEAVVLGGLPSGWRNVYSQPQLRSFSVKPGPVERALAVPSSADGDSGAPVESHRSPSTVVDVAYRNARDGFVIDGYESGGDGLVVQELSPTSVTLQCQGVRRTFEVASYPLLDGRSLTCVDSPLGSVTFWSVPRFPDPVEDVVPGSLLAPMPGSIVRIAVTEGQQVERGEPLMWLEAMKMQHEVSAPVSGVVTEMRVTEGQQVDVGSVLAVVTVEEDS